MAGHQRITAVRPLSAFRLPLVARIRQLVLETFDRVVKRTCLLHEFVDVCFLRGDHGFLRRGGGCGRYEVWNSGEDRHGGVNVARRII